MLNEVGHGCNQVLGSAAYKDQITVEPGDAELCCLAAEADTSGF